MGQLGWSEEQTLNSDINAILLGEKGHWKELTICYGLEKKPDKVTADIDAKIKAAEGHNELRKTYPRKK